jgi:hypothetical protein
MHPRLLTTLVLMDPVILPRWKSSIGGAFGVAKMSTWRRDLWPSQEEAEKAFRKSKFYTSWDPRVLDRWLRYGLRHLPTSLYPDSTEGDKRVTLKTTKHQELFTFLRPNYEGYKTGKYNRNTHPDVEPDSVRDSPLVRPEPVEIFGRLPNVRPSLLYIFGGESDMSTPEQRNARIEISGIGLGGSGGVKEGRVKEVVLEDIGHLVAMEAVGRCADAAAEWIGAELKRWNANEDEFRGIWTSKSLLEKTTIDDEWRKTVGGPPTNGKVPAQSKL